MQAFTRILAPDGTSVPLVPGDTVGRSVRSALRVNDPRVSEAHALVSLRQGALWLLALRRRLAVDGQPVNEVELVAGRRVALAPGLELRVLSVHVPREVLAIEGPDLPLVALPPVASILVSRQGAPRLRIVPRYDSEASGVVWWDGEQWYRSTPDGVPEAVDPGSYWSVDGHEVRLGSLSLGTVGAEPTQSRGGVDDPLRILTRFDHVEIRRGDDTRVVLGGLSARIVHELASIGQPVGWMEIATQLWPGRDEIYLRRNWDLALGRLRIRLRESGLRPDLVCGNGHGLYLLGLSAGDEVVDLA